MEHRVVRITMLGAVLGALCSLGWAATPLDEGLRLLEQGEGLRALAALKPLAHDGNAEAQYRLGTIYERGLGILPDDYWAWYWYQVAAAQGHTPAVEALQALSVRHHGVPSGGSADVGGNGEAVTPSVVADPPPEASPGGSAEAEGAGVSPTAAADASSPPPAPGAPAAVVPAPEAAGGQVLPPGPGELAALARARLAGVLVDFDPARPLPAARGDDITGQPTSDGPTDAMPRAGRSPSGPLDGALAAAPEAVPEAAPADPDPSTTMVLARLPEADTLAALPESELTALASGGHVVAQRVLALRLHSGRGRVPDLPSAITWYRRAAEAGDAEAQYRLGNLYLMGDGIEADDAWAITWFRRAAAQGHAQAEAHLENLIRLSGHRP